MMTVTLEGTKSLERQLQAMTRAGQRGTVRRAARAGARTVGMEARRRAPRSVRPRHPKGHAYKMIRWGEVESWTDKAEFWVGPIGWGWYLWLHEVGTSRFAAQPFMRPSLETKTTEITTNMGDVFRESIVTAAMR